MLTRIRNAMMTTRRRLRSRFPKSSVEIERVLKQEGFIEDTRWGANPADDPGQAEVYGDRRHSRPGHHGLERVSGPAAGFYVKRDELPWVLSGMGIAIVSTSQV
jgi:small subunit ribosomal protein S8